MEENFKTLVCNNNLEVNQSKKSRLISGGYIKDAIFTLTIPIYGYNKYCEDCFKSISNALENSKDIQIVISDNKECDNDTIIIEKLCKNYFKNNYIYFLNDQTIGQYGNFNRSIELSKTEFVGMIHSDDLLSLDYFHMVRSLIKLNLSNVGYIHCNYLIFSNDFPKNHKNKEYGIIPISKKLISHLGNSQTGIPSCGSIFNKKAFVKSGGFSLNFPSSADAFLPALMITKGYKIYKFTNVTGYYRISINVSIKLNICKDFIKEDYMFMSDWNKNQNLIWHIHNKIYWRYIYSSNIDEKINKFGKMNEEISVKNLDFLGKYKSYYLFGFTSLSFKIITKIIKFFDAMHKIRFSIS